MTSSAGFIPVVHAATESRPDEIDTITAARSVAGAVARLGYATEIIGLDQNLSGLETLPARRPLLVFNLADAVAGDCRLAPMVPARLDALRLPYTGARTGPWLDTLSKIVTKLRLAYAGCPRPNGRKTEGARSGLARDRQARVRAWLARHRPGLGHARRRRRPQDRRTQLALGNRAFRRGLYRRTGIRRRDDGRSHRVEVLPIRETLFHGFGDGAPRITDYDAKWTPGSQPISARRAASASRRKSRNLPPNWSGLRSRAGAYSLSTVTRGSISASIERTRLFILEVNTNPCLSDDAASRLPRSRPVSVTTR